MTEERLKQLLIKCMNWIKTDNYETLNTFENLGFKPDELKELGFKYLQNNNSLPMMENHIMLSTALMKMRVLIISTQMI